MNSILGDAASLEPGKLYKVNCLVRPVRRPTACKSTTSNRNAFCYNQRYNVANGIARIQYQTSLCRWRDEHRRFT